MVNVENINKVIESLKDESNYFNMEHWYNPTSDELKPSCIGGWFDYHAGKMDDNLYNNKPETHELIGISFDDMDELCAVTPIPLSEITRYDAIKTLEHLRDTGKVEWQRA